MGTTLFRKTRGHLNRILTFFSIIQPNYNMDKMILQSKQWKIKQ